jgi:hypothetical protein
MALLEKAAEASSLTYPITDLMSIDKKAMEAKTKTSRLGETPSRRTTSVRFQENPPSK